MNEYLGIFILVLSVLVGGGIVVVLEKANKSMVIKLLLSLSGGFLLAISFIHLIPEIYIHSGVNAGYYILLGFLIQLFLEYFSKGIEHGHVHVHGGRTTIPWTLFIALSVHSLIEGIPLEAGFHLDALDSHSAEQLFTGDVDTHSHNHNHRGAEGLRGLFLGVVLHNIPVAVALMTLLIAAGFSKLKSWSVLLAFSLMAPIGIALGHFGAAHFLLDMEMLLAIVVGMFLHISTTIIFESSENHKFNFVKLLSLLSGVVLAIFTI
jgi:zinc transporter ZupT